MKIMKHISSTIGVHIVKYRFNIKDNLIHILLIIFSMFFLNCNSNEGDPLLVYVDEYKNIVKINNSLLKREKESFSLDLPDIKNLDIEKTKIDSKNISHFIWHGQITEKGEGYSELLDVGKAIFVIKNDRITGKIFYKNKTYSLKYLQDGLHEISNLDTKQFPKEHPAEFINIEENSIDNYQTESDLSDGNNFDSTDIVINVLVAYTPLVDDVVDDIESLCELAIEETNESFENSDIQNISLRLSRIIRVDYDESGSFSTDLTRFRNTNDGFMDNIHSIRLESGSDICVLLVKNDDYCGLASTIGAVMSTAFAAVNYDCATGYYSFGHEIGHLVGARHNRQEDSNGTYNHGYYYEPDSWRTVMSYDCPSDCTRIPYWSSPLIEYDDVVMGTVEYEDNARVWRENSFGVSNFISCDPRPCVENSCLPAGHCSQWCE